MKISKNNYSPNDRFLIKIFMKIISLDSSQRVPPMSPCPPLIITTVCPWLINPLSDPWDFNKSNGILLRSNWRKPYPKFYGSEFYGSGCVYLGVVKKTSQKVPTYLPGGGGFINPVLALAGTGDDATIEECSQPMLEGTSGLNRVTASSPKQGLMFDDIRFDLRMPLDAIELQSW